MQKGMTIHRPPVERMQLAINGADPDNCNKKRPHYLSKKKANKTIAFFKAAFSNPMTGEQMAERIGDDMKKSVTISTGLTYYDLRAPALNLFPTVTPLRNSIPRLQRDHPGDSAHWKTVDNTIGSGQPYMGWVPEGQRSASMSYRTSNHSLSYMTLGEEDSLTEEARFAAQGFEDEDALVQLRLLLRTFIKEEAAILGGNQSLALGTPSTPVVSTVTTGGSLAVGTYSVIVVALTQEGYLNSSIANGVAQSLAITGNDGQSYTLNGGSSNKSSSGSVVTTGTTSTISATATPIAGAVAYAWYASTPAGSEKLQAITTVNSVALTAITTTNQAVSAITADCSTNTNYAYDGMLTWGLKQSGYYANPYVNYMATSTAAAGISGTGTPLTASYRGSVTQVDTMFQTMWNTALLSPTVGYLNSQELLNVTNKVLAGGSSTAPLVRYYTEMDQSGGMEYKLTAAGVVSYYYNPFTPDGGVRIPLNIHPYLAPGTMLFWAENLPPWYVSNAVPECAVMQTRQDYYAEVWPKTTRAQFYGVYTQEVMAMYVPFSMGIITNIGNG
jgi:hypothetical protein